MSSFLFALSSLATDREQKEGLPVPSTCYLHINRTLSVVGQWGPFSLTMRRSERTTPWRRNALLPLFSHSNYDLPIMVDTKPNPPLRAKPLAR